ncbi:MAG: hypothetical protein A3G18_11245 [Rhodospirillales bacterium RIFCSPLOWO2_12_FULL_58_28]|nr:MAG: hypothetical protein A3H92_10390 [Rhodospirillales bacterium RIFCSPLOWO2_02_FULL_58_16]OHC77767.1 MAG: hypothetical protein A3G18_11245 [Rhodospirillales bacterium RIFCSPLOWO2_12_FULL_58_28]
MSLILDALKKSEEERKSGAVPESAAVLKDAPMNKRRLWPSVAAGGLVLFIVVVGVFLWRSSMVETPPPTAEQTPVAPVGPEPPKLTIKAPPPAIIEPAPEPAKVVVEPAPAPEPKPATAPLLPPAIDVKIPVVSIPQAAVAKSRAGEAGGAAAHNKRGQAFEQEGLYDRAIEEYTNAILLKPDYAEAYLGRGWTQEAKGNHEQAIDNFSRALQASPSYGEAFFGRGWVHEQLGRFDSAIEDYTQAIRHAPDLSDAYFSRGFLNFYNEQPDKAADDFSKSLRKANKSLVPYALLWRYLSRVRSGGDGKKELEENVGGINLNAWPGIIVALYMGKADPSQVLAKTKDNNTKKQSENECVAFFFLGQYHLVQGDKDKAAAFFRKTLDTGVTGYRQYEAAKTELRILGALK